MKKGFTLIELLAVIIILAIIAMIAIPIVISIIENSRRNAAVVSADNYIRAVNYKIAQEEVNGNIVPDGEYIIGENELAIDAQNIDKITGAYEVTNLGVLTASLCVNNYSIEYSSGKAYYKGDANYCGGEYVFTEPEATQVSALCEGENADSIYSSTDKYKIKTVEDLVCLSNIVNSGKNFSGKEIYLLNDINISNASSYKNSTTTKYGDVNGNGAVEGLLTELTTGAGFKPIGNNNQKFSGTFLGYAYTISNLMINRNTQYVGLFGYNTGTIKGIILKDVDVYGSSEVGGLVGYSTGTVRSVYVTGTVSGGQEVGGICGFATNSGVFDDAVANTTVSGGNIIGGVVGRAYSENARGVMLGGNVASGSNNYSGIIFSQTVSSVYGGSLNTITKVGKEGYSGERFERATIEVLDNYIDTYIGGDNNSDGYYFDYDSSGNITLYSTERKPIQTNKLKGEGTIDKPYIIKSVNDWKLASATVNSGSKYYKLSANIDFTGRQFYPLGTNANKFTGYLNGGMYTVSNISVSAYDRTGVIGYNQGTIEGIVFRNITVRGNSNIGIIGYNEGAIKGVNVYNSNVSGAGRVGGFVGYSSASGVIRDVYVESTVTGTGTSIGGAIGYDQGTTKSLVVKSTTSGHDFVGAAFGEYRGYEKEVYVTVVEGSVTATSRGGRTAGYNSASSTNGIIRYVKGVSLTSPSPQNIGIEIASDNIGAYIDTCDTVLGGDDDNNGYYMDYDSNNNFVAHSIAKEPFKTLSGSGTQSDPYRIANASDWRAAAATRNGTVQHYVLTGDIDFTNAHFYPLSYEKLGFSGSLKGNMHTISNFAIDGYNNVGIIGINSGTVEGLNINNANISGSGNYIGIVGFSTGTIKGINISNITIDGLSNARNVGGLVGRSEGLVQDITVQGTITGYMNVGGAIGYGTSTSKYIISNTTVSGNDEIGGVAGRIYGVNSHLTNVIQIGGSSTANSRAGRVAFYADDKTKHYALSTIPIQYTNSYTSNGTNVDASVVNDLDAISSLINIETSATGDTDGSGYIFGYNNDHSKIVVLKAN